MKAKEILWALNIQKIYFPQAEPHKSLKYRCVADVDITVAFLWIVYESHFISKTSLHSSIIKTKEEQTG